MSLFLAFFSLTVATTAATGAAAVFWGRFVGQGMDGPGARERTAKAGPDIRTW